jgi:heterodisulfide reductase subunit A-like polyferredoxin
MLLFEPIDIGGVTLRNRVMMAVHGPRLGRDELVNTCISGNECHYGRSVSCAVNPAAGREAELDRGRSARPRRVVIVGGGPAGVECARLAANRGHEVRLFDEQPALGGALRDLGRHRPEFANYSERLAAHLSELIMHGEGIEDATRYVGGGLASNFSARLPAHSPSVTRSHRDECCTPHSTAPAWVQRSKARAAF